MNPKLKRIVEDIDKIEIKIAEWQTQLRETMILSIMHHLIIKIPLTVFMKNSIYIIQQIFVDIL